MTTLTASSSSPSPRPLPWRAGFARGLVAGLLAAVLAAVALPAGANEDLMSGKRAQAPSGMDAELAAALAALSMVPQQAQAVAQVLQRISAEQIEMAARLLRRNLPDKDQTIRLRTRGVVADHRDDVAKILTPEQLTRWQELVEPALARALTDTRSRDRYRYQQRDTGQPCSRTFC